MPRNRTSRENLHNAKISEPRRAKQRLAGSITDVPGIRIGHAQERRARTGCTVVLCDADGATAGIDVRGAAPGTRETDLLDPVNLVERVHAIVLAGGSAFGLDAACGVMAYLEERGVGFDTRAARVPIVPAAVIYDLAVGDSRVRPDAGMGRRACENASSRTVLGGPAGVGAGATVGKILGPGFASPGGIGTASVELPGGAIVGVIVVVNAFGDIVDPESGQILAGARSPNGPGWLNTSVALGRGSTAIPRIRAGPKSFAAIENTTLAVVATNAALTKAQARRVATMAHDGLARAIRPVHTMFDGDTIFALSTGMIVADVTAVGSAAADLLAAAIARVGRLSGAPRGSRKSR